MRELLETLSVSTLPMFAYRLDEPAQPAYDPLGAFVVRTEPATLTHWRAPGVRRAAPRPTARSGASGAEPLEPQDEH